MNWSISTRALFLLIGVTALSACQDTQEIDRREYLLGRWEIQEARRNGQATESLEELYFEFFQDGKMTTNLLGVPETASYDLEENELRQRDSQMDIDYQIEELTDSLLVLTTNLRDYDFRFRLHKRIQEE